MSKWLSHGQKCLTFKKFVHIIRCLNINVNMAEIDLHEEADIAEVLRAAGEASVSALTAVEEKLGPTSARTMAIRAALGEQAPLALQVETPDDNRSKWKSPTDKDAVLNRKFPMHYADLQEYQYSRLQECPTSLLARYQSQAYQVEDWANAVIFQQMLFDLGYNKMPGLMFLAKGLEKLGRIQEAIAARLEIAALDPENHMNNKNLGRLKMSIVDNDDSLPDDHMDLTKEHLKSINKISTARLLWYAKAAWKDKKFIQHIRLFNKELLNRPDYNAPNNLDLVVPTMIHLALAYEWLGDLDNALKIQYELRNLYGHYDETNAKVIEKLESMILSRKLRTAKASKTASR